MNLKPRVIIIPVVNAALRCFNPNPALFSEKNRPIFVSNLLIGEKHYNFDRRQKIAALLHEIGHVKHDDKSGPEAEHAADSFAKECGFGREMIEVLNKIIQVDAPYVPATAIGEYETRKTRLAQ